MLKNVTLEDCIKLYESYGWMAVIRNGKVVDFAKRKWRTIGYANNNYAYYSA